MITGVIIVIRNKNMAASENVSVHHIYTRRNGNLNEKTPLITSLGEKMMRFTTRIRFELVGVYDITLVQGGRGTLK